MQYTVDMTLAKAMTLAAESPNAFGNTVVVIRDGHRVEGESTVDETLHWGGGDEWLEFTDGGPVQVFFDGSGFYFDTTEERS